jgi:hypothetical protein
VVGSTEIYLTLGLRLLDMISCQQLLGGLLVPALLALPPPPSSQAQTTLGLIEGGVHGLVHVAA